MRKTARYILTIVLSAILLSASVIFLANDAFALTQSEESTEIDLSGGASPKEVGNALKESGLIKSRLWFRTYLALRGKSLKNINPTRVTIEGGSGFDGIHRALTGESTEKRREIRVTIPEGSTVEDIAEIICDKYGICTKEDFISELQNGDFSERKTVSSVMGELKSPKYRLEGYLYPDTYCFYSDASAHHIIDRMLANFEHKLDESYLLACKKKGMTVNEAVTLASIIIKEAKLVSDYPKVSSVFHNRLNNRTFAGRLQSDATLVYLLGRSMEPSDKTIESRYNTYKYGGLPPSPICCPDMTAISYALCPDNTNYYYFVTRSDGKIFYANDYETHKKNLESVKGFRKEEG